MIVLRESMGFIPDVLQHLETQMISRQPNRFAPGLRVDQLFFLGKRDDHRRAHIHCLEDVHRRVQLAQVCMATGNNDIGRPILQELAEEIERRGLEHWENPDLVAQPLVLLYRCLDDPQDPAGDKRKLYAQICRLDPSRALGLR